MPRSIRALSVSFALGALATATAVHAQPRVIYADAHAPYGGNGNTWPSAFRDLQDAVAAANADPARISRGVQVRIAQGVYRPDRNSLNPSMYFSLNSGVTLMGGFAGGMGANPDARDTKRFVSVLSGDLAGNDGPNFTGYEENSRCLVHTASGDLSVTLDGLTISGGNADTTQFPSSLGIISTSPTTNPSVYGRITIRDCDVVRNRAVQGPVLRLNGSVLTRSRVNDNLCFHNAVWMLATSIDACEFRHNRINSSSGLVYLSAVGGPAVRITRSLFADNLGSGGGVVQSYESATDFQLINCTVANNATSTSDAIANWYGTVKLRNCIVAGNTRPGFPLGITQVYAGNPGRLDIDATTLIDNGNAGLSVASGGPALKPVISGDPRFVFPAGPDGDPATWQDNDYHLRPGSPAIDRGTTSDSLFGGGYMDLDGNPLYDDPGTPNLGVGSVFYADLGCYEFTGRLCPADFNASGTLTAADIFDFLTAWFAADARADANADGAITPADIFAYLQIWFAGC